MSMIIGMSLEVYHDPIMRPGFDTNANFSIVIARFGCCIALHLKCIPDYTKGMKLMNFANNNPDDFLSSRLAFFIGLMQCLVALCG